MDNPSQNQSPSPSQRIEAIQDKEGWSDRTLLSVLLDTINVLQPPAVAEVMENINRFTVVG